MKKIFENNWLKVLLTGILFIVVYKSVDNLNNIFSFFGTFLSVITPCIIGALIALFAYNPVRKVEDLFQKMNLKPALKYKKLFAVLIVYFIAFFVLGIAIKYIVPVLYKNVEELIVKIPVLIEHLNGLFSKLEFMPQLNIGAIGEKLLGYLDFERINHYLSVITGIANSFVSFLVSIIISIYIILEKEQITAFFVKLRERMTIKEKTDLFVRYTRKIVALFRSYFTGLFIDSVIIGAVTTIVFAAFKVPYAVFLGLIVAIGNMIPFFGPIVAAIIIYFIGMISLGPLNALWLLAFQLVLGQIDANVIQPKIIGSYVGISPLLVLISVTVFGGLFGPLGMVFGVPICASAKLVLDDYLADGKIDGAGIK